MSDPSNPTSRPIVLVHGAWVGEWCWEPIIGLLEAAGRPVYAVSLTGHGRRRGESAPDVTLGDHVADVVAVFREGDLADATLVAHSYGGRVITKAWPEVAARVRRMVYLDAHAPLGSGDDGTGKAPRYAANDVGMIPFAEFQPDEAVLGGDRAVAEFTSRLAPQSARTLSEPFEVDLPAGLDKTYVFATAERSAQFRPYAEAAQRDPSWRYVEIPATHWLMYTHPRQVAAIILDEEASEEDDGR
jgi:pimeloyl-ACP methyl ester carboxylesterase